MEAAGEVGSAACLTLEMRCSCSAARSLRRFARLAVGRGAGLVAALVGCQPKSAFVPPPPAQVTVARPIERPVEEALEFFQNIPRIRNKLETLN